MPFPSPGDLPNPGIESGFLVLQADSLLSEPPSVKVYPLKHSVQFSCSAVSDSLRPHGRQHTRLPCPSPTPKAWSNSCPLSQWCHPAISSSVIPFSSCLQSFQMSQFFASGGQSIGVLVPISVLPMNIQDWFPLGWTGWISLQWNFRGNIFDSQFVEPGMWNPRLWRADGTVIFQNVSCLTLLISGNCLLLT